MTALIYVIIIVALLTYFVMFNINSLAQGFGQIYDIKKKQVVRVMKIDGKESWKLRGERFEVFRPKHENPEPSEWYIALYALMHPTAILGLYRGKYAQDRLKRTNSESVPQPAKSAGIASLFRTRNQPVHKVEEPDFSDQPWVIQSKPPHRAAEV